MHKGKTHVINWEAVTLGKDQGGLGIKKMRTLNFALMEKLAWRLLTENDALWARVVCNKYMRGEPNI